MSIIKNVESPQKRRICDQIFDEFLLACHSRVAKKDLAFVTARGYAKLLAQIWRPEIGPRIFDEIRYSELAKIANAYQWSKKPNNNAISVVRCSAMTIYSSSKTEGRSATRRSRWRWSESIKALNIRRRGPYHARHSSVTWQLMLGKNLLWVAKQHGHSVEVMLRMYAAWLEGATDSDIHAIKQAIEKRPATREAIHVLALHFQL